MNQEYFDLYKLCVEQAEKISDRRMKNNWFFILLHSAILSFMAKIQTIGKESVEVFFFYFVMIIVGIVFCSIWGKSLASYRELNAAKFQIIAELEDSMPVHCFKKEWEIFRENSKNISFSVHEERIVKVFHCTYCIILGFTSIRFVVYICHTFF